MDAPDVIFIIMISVFTGYVFSLYQKAKTKKLTIKVYDYEFDTDRWSYDTALPRILKFMELVGETDQEITIKPKKKE